MMGISIDAGKATQKGLNILHIISSYSTTLSIYYPYHPYPSIQYLLHLYLMALYMGLSENVGLIFPMK